MTKNLISLFILFFSIFSFAQSKTPVPILISQTFTYDSNTNVIADMGKGLLAIKLQIVDWKNTKLEFKPDDDFDVITVTKDEDGFQVTVGKNYPKELQAPKISETAGELTIEIADWNVFTDGDAQAEARMVPLEDGEPSPWVTFADPYVPFLVFQNPTDVPQAVKQPNTKQSIYFWMDKLLSSAMSISGTQMMFSLECIYERELAPGQMATIPVLIVLPTELRKDYSVQIAEAILQWTNNNSPDLNNAGFFFNLRIFGPDNRRPVLQIQQLALRMDLIDFAKNISKTKARK